MIEVLSDDGTVLTLMEDVVFRSVKPEQIQMAIAAMGAPEDCIVCYTYYAIL